MQLDESTILVTYLYRCLGNGPQTKSTRAFGQALSFRGCSEGELDGMTSGWRVEGFGTFLAPLKGRGQMRGGRL